MFATKQTTEKGFVALISAILISVSLLILVVAVGFEGYFSRFTIFETDLKEKSIYLADACVQAAILKLVQDEDYTGGDTINDGIYQCVIDSVINTGSNKEIRVESEVEQMFTKLVVNISLISSSPYYQINAWEEVATLSP